MLTLKTGGYDHNATEVRAYLVPLGITPPELSGGGIPSDYDSYSYASVIRTALVPTSIAVSPTSLSMQDGDIANLSATCLDQNNNPITGVSFGWSSDNSAYAAVDSSGVVTAVTPGTANIIVTCGSLTTSVPVTVSAFTYPQIVISSVPPIGSNGNISGKVGPGWQGYKVAVLLNVYGGWWTKPTFKSPLTKIGSEKWSARLTTGGSDAYGSEVRAYLIPIGVSMPLCSGGLIPASYDQYTYDDVVRPWPALSSVRVTPSSVKLISGQSSSLTAKAYGGNVQIPASFSWTSANSAVASVDQNGFVQANSHGSTKITVIASTSDRTRKITVNVNVK